MQQIFAENWWLVVIALLIGLLVAWWIFAASRKTKVEIEREDAADEPKAAKRNQALIDAPTAGSVQPTIPPAASAGLAGAGTAATAAAEQAAERAEAEKVVAEPAPAPRPTTAVPAASGDSDDLRRIKGVGPKLVTQLNELGVTSFAQIAAWDEAEVDRIDSQLGRFQGRIRRDSWVEQAKLLEAGDDAAFASKFGNA